MKRTSGRMGKLGVEEGGGGRERAKIEAARGFTRRVTLMKIAKDEVARAWRRWRWRRWRRREEMVGEAVGIHEGGIRISETRLA